MTRGRRILRSCGLLAAGLGLAWGCAFDDSLREYLDAHFWLPYSKSAGYLAKKNVRRLNYPYAGMADEGGNTPLEQLRSAYREISGGDGVYIDPAKLQKAMAAARAYRSLSAVEREEVALIEAKIEMRTEEGDPDDTLEGARDKMRKFLTTARDPAFRSEARGWLAHIYYLQGNQAAAGKIYLDELNRNGTNLSREVLLNSLKMDYGYDGGPELLKQLGEYFDTAEHAAFAVQLATNPHWNEYADLRSSVRSGEVQATYTRIRGLLEAHSELLKSGSGAGSLAALGMRTALRMGDPPGALKIADEVPAGAPLRDDPDFNWMLASSRFLTHDYAGAEEPLLKLFRSSLATEPEKASAAYGLCGVYEKTGNAVEQIRFALWLRSGTHEGYWAAPAGIADQSIYFAPSGFDLNLLLDDETSIEQIESFLSKYPDVPDVRLVKYSLAVRLARENRYAEAARIYAAIGAIRRAPRMRQLAALYAEASRTDLSAPQRDEAKYRYAAFLGAHSGGIYFNDALWHGLQRYALRASTDTRLDGQERQTLTADERKLKDDQEERWRAYVVLREVVDAEGKTALGREAAQLATQCLRGISDRFGRQDEIRKADIELSAWLRN